MTEEGPGTYELAILQALQHKPVYYGTVEPEVIAKRRAKTKVAKVSRKANRKA